MINTDDADVMGDEPIWANVPKGDFSKAITETQSDNKPCNLMRTEKIFLILKVILQMVNECHRMGDVRRIRSLC